MRYYLYMFSYVMVVYALFCQGVIEGRVIDSDTKEPLIGTHVYLLSNWRKGAITDADGRFELILVSEDMKDSLIVSYVGFREMLLPVQSHMEIELDPVEAQGETVVVIAEPLISEEFKYVEIKKIEIYTNPAAKADPILAVNSLPSSTTTDESANISLRGSSPIETGVYFNNVPIYDAVRYSQLNGIGTFSIFNTDIIKDVTVFPGNPPLEFGNATSGIISIQTDDRILEANSNSAILSLANIGFSRQQRINNISSLKIFSNWQPSGPIKKLNREALDDIESFTSNDLGVYWYGGTPDISWKILGYGVTEGYQFNFKHPSFEGIFDQEKRRGFLISSLEKPIRKGRLSFNTGLSFSNGDYAYSNVAFNVRKRDLFIGLNYLLSNEKYSFKTGLSYDHRFAIVKGNFHEFGYALGEDHPTISLDESVNIKVPEGFGYFKYFLSDKLAFGTGIRKNLSMRGVQSYWSNQANISYSENYWTFTFGLGRYNKNGLLENTGEPFSTQSTQRSIDIKRSKGSLDIALSLFDKDGEIDNVDYQAKGLELFIDLQVNSKIQASGSITLLDAGSERQTYLYDLSYFIRGNLSWDPGKFWTLESTLVARQGTLTSEVISSIYDPELDVYQPLYAETDFRLNNYMNIGLAISKVIEVSDEINMIAFASLNNVPDRVNVRSFEYNFDYSSRQNSLFSRRMGYLGVVVNF